MALWPLREEMLYGIKLYDDEAYEIASGSKSLSSQALLSFVMGLIGAVFIIGLFLIAYAFSLWNTSAKFAPYEQYEFERSPSLANGGYQGQAMGSERVEPTRAEQTASRAKQLDDLKKWVESQKKAS